MENILFETERLKIVEYTLDRLEEIYELYQDKDIIKYTLIDKKGKTRDQLREGVKMYQDVYEKFKNKQGKWLVVTKESKEVVGFVGLFYVKELEKTELSYALMERYRGKGYATESIKGLKEYAFKKLKMRELCALIRSSNVRSHNVIRRVDVNNNQCKKVNLKGNFFDLYEMENIM